jgi:hypothetical protein
VQKFGFSPVFEKVLFFVSVACLAFTILWFVVFDRNAPQTEKSPTDVAEKKRFFVWSAVGIAFCALIWIAGLASGF